MSSLCNRDTATAEPTEISFSVHRKSGRRCRLPIVITKNVLFLVIRLYMYYYYK